MGGADGGQPTCARLAVPRRSDRRPPDDPRDSVNPSPVLLLAKPCDKRVAQRSRSSVCPTALTLPRSIPTGCTGGSRGPQAVRQGRGQGHAGHGVCGLHRRLLAMKPPGGAPRSPWPHHHRHRHKDPPGNWLPSQPQADAGAAAIQPARGVPARRIDHDPVRWLPAGPAIGGHRQLLLAGGATGHRRPGQGRGAAIRRVRVVLLMPVLSGGYCNEHLTDKHFCKWI